jgi:hypothetical protein
MHKHPEFPYLLGLAGLIPFVFFSFVFVARLDDELLRNLKALAIYAAVILSFLGGTRWGAEIARNPQNPSSLTLSLAMLPSIFGWGALVVYEFQNSTAIEGASLGLSLAIITVAFVGQLIWDLAAIKQGTFPGWYALLRILLTLVAVACLLAAIFATIIYPPIFL